MTTPTGDQYIASMNKGEAAGVIQGCWIMSSIQSAEDQSGKWAIVNMPALDGIDGATNYANCGGASWAVSSNCKNTELAFDFLKTTFGGSVELYDDLLLTPAQFPAICLQHSRMFTIRLLISMVDRQYTKTLLSLQAKFPQLTMVHIIMILEVH